MSKTRLRAWTRPEEKRLIRLYEREWTTREIAAALGRTIWAVERRASDLRRKGECVPFAAAPRVHKNYPMTIKENQT